MPLAVMSTLWMTVDSGGGGDDAASSSSSYKSAPSPSSSMERARRGDDDLRLSPAIEPSSPLLMDQVDNGHPAKSKSWFGYLFPNWRRPRKNSVDSMDGGGYAFFEEPGPSIAVEADVEMADHAVQNYFVPLYGPYPDNSFNFPQHGLPFDNGGAPRPDDDDINERTSRVARRLAALCDQFEADFFEAARVELERERERERQIRAILDWPIWKFLRVLLEIIWKSFCID